jgi:hypothetical protein
LTGSVGILRDGEPDGEGEGSRTSRQVSRGRAALLFRLGVSVGSPSPPARLNARLAERRLAGGEGRGEGGSLSPSPPPLSPAGPGLARWGARRRGRGESQRTPPTGSGPRAGAPLPLDGVRQILPSPPAGDDPIPSGTATAGGEGSGVRGIRLAGTVRYSPLPPPATTGSTRLPQRRGERGRG